MRNALLGLVAMVALTGCSESGINIDTTNEMTYRSSASAVSQSIEDPRKREVFDMAVTVLYQHVADKNDNIVGKMNANASYTTDDINKGYEQYQKDLDSFIDNSSVDDFIARSSSLINEYIIQPRIKTQDSLISEYEEILGALENRSSKIIEMESNLEKYKSNFPPKQKILINKGVSFELLEPTKDQIVVRIINLSDFPTGRYQGPVNFTSQNHSLSTYLYIEPINSGETIDIQSRPGGYNWSRSIHGQDNKKGVTGLISEGFQYDKVLNSDEEKRYKASYLEKRNAAFSRIAYIESQLKNEKRELQNIEKDLEVKKKDLDIFKSELNNLKALLSDYM